MGEPAVILEGVDSAASREALYSTVHGAGRAMSRTQAAGRRRRGRPVTPGRIDFTQVRRELAARGIELRGGAADEAPGAYKRLPEVLSHHAGTVRVLHELHPIGVAMAGAGTFDPFRD
jgi:tRNA-splicing ligase RtcB